MEEQWKNTPGYEGEYQVSDQGRVRSLDHDVPTSGGTRRLKGRVLKPQRHSAGYLQVQLHGRTALIHRLVLLAFVGPPPDGLEGAHSNGDKHDNVLSNLRYATPLSNAHDRRLHGTSGRGSANTAAKLTDEAVRLIRALRGVVSAPAISEEFGVHVNHVRRIWSRARWAHV